MFKIFLIFISGWFLGNITTVGLFTDDSDAGFFKRSGFRVLTDYKTGLQYIEGVRGGVYPRLNKNGEHVNINTKE